MTELLANVSFYAFGLNIGLMVYFIASNRRTHLLRATVAMCLAFGVWSLMAMHTMISPEESERTLWFQLSAFGWAFYPSVSIYFCSEISRMRQTRFGRAVLMTSIFCGIAFLAIALAHAPSFVDHFVKTTFGWGIIKPLSPVMVLYIIFIMLANIYCVWVLVQWRRTTQYIVERRQATAMLFGALSVMLPGMLMDIWFPMTGTAMPPVTPIFAVIWFTVLIFCSTRYRFLELNPALAAGEIMTRITDFIILLDREQSIRQMNAAARNALGYFATDVGGMPFSKIAPALCGEKANAYIEKESQLLHVDGKEVPVRVTMSPRYNRYGDLIGNVVIAADLRAARELKQKDSERRLTQRELLEKSQALNSLLDHTSQGFLSFGEDLAIRGTYSRKSCELLEKKSLAGLDFIEAVWSDMSTRNETALRNLLREVFRETRQWKLDALLPLLPTEKIMGSRTIRLQYLFLDTDPSLERILMVILNDSAECEQFQARMARENAKLTMVLAVLKDLEEYYALLGEWRIFFHEEIFHLQQAEASPRDHLYDLFRHIHTFKGNFARYGMQETCEHLNRYEDCLVELLEGEPDSAAVEHAIAQLRPEEWIQQDLSILQESLGQDPMYNRKTISLSREDMSDFEQEIRGQLAEPQRTLLLHRFQRMYCLEIKQQLGEYRQFVQRLARERQFAEPDFVVEGTEVMVNGTLFRKFLRTWVHLFSNAVMHGMQPEHVRRELGKAAVGRLECLVERQAGMLVLSLSDDGAGLNAAEVRAIAAARRLASDEELAAMNDVEVLQMIFRPGFSRLEVADGMDGRGIGLYAVSCAVHQLGGSIRVYSRPERFTRFVMEIPMHQEDMGE